MDRTATGLESVVISLCANKAQTRLKQGSNRAITGLIALLAPCGWARLSLRCLKAADSIARRILIVLVFIIYILIRYISNVCDAPATWRIAWASTVQNFNLVEGDIRLYSE
jgi:hypothetical protein